MATVSLNRCLCRPNLLTNFQNTFNVRISAKFVIKLDYTINDQTTP